MNRLYIGGQKGVKPVALKDLARSTKLNKATAFRLLSSLREKNLVQQTNEQRFYSPRIWKKVNEIKRLGYAVSVKERYAFTAGIAASCLLSEDVLGSIAVIGPSERIEAFGIEKAGSIVTKIARQISATAANPSSVKITSRPLEVGE